MLDFRTPEGQHQLARDGRHRSSGFIDIHMRVNSLRIRYISVVGIDKWSVGSFFELLQVHLLELFDRHACFAWSNGNQIMHLDADDRAHHLPCPGATA